MTDFLLPAPVDNDACDQLPGMALPTPRGNHKVFYPIFPPDKKRTHSPKLAPGQFPLNQNGRDPLRPRPLFVSTQVGMLLSSLSFRNCQFI